MSANSSSSFDVGPLSWVKAEIEHSLTEARLALDRLNANQADEKAAKQIAAQLHQVTGALAMVGLGAATRFNEEVEALVSTFEAPNMRTALVDRIRVVKRATNHLSSYLNSLIDGEPDRPMVLAATYVQLNRARGATDATESDLFAPDLGAVVPMPEDTVALPKSEMLVEAIKQRRALYQSGLLKLLKDKDYVAGARDMRNATLAIEALQVTSPTRSFWYTASGFFDAVASDPAESGALAVQLFGKVDQQIKLLIEGVQRVPEKLFRDLLMVIGKSKATSARVKSIREIYRLDQLLAAPANALSVNDDDALKSAVRTLREQVQAAKDSWMRFTSGNRAAVDLFCAQTDSISKIAQPNAGLAELLRVINLVGPHMRKTGVPPNEVQSIEVATALLFVESSLDHYFQLRSEFAAQAAGVSARIKDAMSGRELAPLDPSASAVIDDISRRAQERLLLFQVGQEVQVNLTAIEGTLDGFFRDPVKSAELSTLPPLFAQVQGALAILELDEAAALNQLLRERVNQFASGAVKGAGADAEAVAEGVSAMGLYIAAIQQGSGQAREALLPALIRFGLAEKPPEAEESVLKAPSATVSATDVEVGKQKVQERYEEWKQQPEQTASRAQLREAVQELKSEATLLGDAASVSQSEATLKAIDASFDPSRTGITEAIAELAPSKPTEAPAPQMVQLLDAPSSEVDQELLEIFLEEATEVVGTIDSELGAARNAPHDKETLTTIRRAFHTLKGSGRMVGLNDLGEVAWNCEQVMNKRLKDDEAATPGLLGFIELASHSFRHWIESLQASGTASIDGQEIARLAELLKNGKEPEFGVPAPASALTSPVSFDAFAIDADVGVPSLEMPAAMPPEAPPLAVDLPPPSIDIDFADVAPITPADDATSSELDHALEPMPALEIAVPSLVEASDAAAMVSATAEPATQNVDLPSLDAVFAELPAIETAPNEMVPVEMGAVEASLPLEPAATGVEELLIGEIELSSALFGIYLEEAQTHAATLENEMGALEANPQSAVSYEFMRAAHTLTSSSRTTGFEAIADVAHALEKWLQAAIEYSPELDGERLSVTRQAVDVLGGMVLQLHTREAPTQQPELVQLLHAMRERLQSGAPVGEGTNWKRKRLLDVDLDLDDDSPQEAVSPDDATSVADPIPEAVVETDVSDRAAVTETPTEIDFSDSFFDEIAPPVATGEAAAAQVSEAFVDAPESAAQDPVKAIEDAFFSDEGIAPSAAAQVESEPVIDSPSVDAFDFETIVAEVAPTFAAPSPAPAEPPAVADDAFAFLADTFPAADSAAATSAEDLPVAETELASRSDALDAGDQTSSEVSAIFTPTVEPTNAPEPPVHDDPAALVTASGLAFAAGAVTAAVAVGAVDESTAEKTEAKVEAEAEAAPEPTPARVEPAFEAGKDRRSMVDDVDQDLLPIFLEEAKEIVPQVGDALRRWRATPEVHSPVTELARHLHTLKGSARMAGLMRLGELAHVLETRVIEMDKLPTPESQRFDQVDDGLDRFNATLERLSAGELATPIEIPAMAEIAAPLAGALPGPMALLATARAEIAAEGEKTDGRERQALLRVNADLIDRFVNEAGELAIARSRVDLELQAFKRGLGDLNDNIARMKSQLREIEIGAESQIQSRIKEAEQLGEQFDPLEFDRFSRMQELTRFMAESLNDVVTLQQTLQKNIDEADLALLQQGRLNRDLQQGLMGVRLVPLGNLQDRFYRLVRQTAKELDKKANLEFRGVRVEIDRSVLEKITAPFEHLLRNAVGHGLESPAERVARGKSEIGEISIDAQQSGNEVVLTLSDDGAGLNFARIREKAIAQGLLAADAEINEAQLTQFIFMAGFSTAENVSQIAGRGVGMDVVRNEIVSLGGRIDIASTPGRGTTFTIALPLTLAVTQAVMLTVGETTYAIPSVMIEQVQEFKGKRYEPLLSLSEIEWKGNKYPLRSMEALLGGQPKVSVQRRAYVILAKGGQQRAAVQVDTIIGNREIVVKSIGPQLARIPGIAGATVLGSGQVVLIMNPVQLVYRETATVSIERDAGFTNPASPSSAQDAPPELPVGQSLAEAIAAGEADAATPITPVLATRATPLVMVVDDSLTVRKITSRMLTREGFEVVTAKDGVDGLQQLQDVEPDVILLDIEMPRMDGFEFARNVRLDANWKSIPIIMITSRTADKHRNRAMELGVNEYMGKPYQEEQLLAAIRSFTDAT